MISNSKIWTIVSHEYMSKVKSKGFILGTFLGPLTFLVFIGIVVLINVISQDDTSKKLAILDKSNLIVNELVKIDSKKYYQTNKSPEELNKLILADKIDGYAIIDENVIDNGKATIYSKGGGGSGLVTYLESNLEQVVRKNRLTKSGVSNEMMEFIDKRIDVSTEKITENGTEKDYTEAFAFIGYILGFAIYMLIFIYGSFVSRAVIEEKSNRIVEIIVSSVKPFELMFGKVIGIGLVGFTQVGVWIILFIIFSSSAGYVANTFWGDKLKDKKSQEQLVKNMNKMNSNSPMGSQMTDENMESNQKVANMLKNIPSISPLLVVGFLFYFLIGYLIYSTLFAAVGSAVDQESDAAQLQLPVSLPVIIPILVIPQVMSNPDSTFSTIMSLIPFFTPILMTVRIAATSVPIWQIAFSIVLCVLTFLGALWVSAKIYKIGILMTGKKPSFKDLYKWIKMS